eukprot:CAMPEP_0177645498 /NCGR_PEP_ID=MMETSP0447-20121125/9282_1 /TAXON_ID=0 /ORGANISM="Stygamoeba regulata, Strain BSH-02190019" /LENGTH=330 /DNA_ID=CAMNT_0019147987 /DNA_START=127 /DNA_END=1119 /DNA_ORIENTATION=+
MTVLSLSNSFLFPYMLLVTLLVLSNHLAGVLASPTCVFTSPSGHVFDYSSVDTNNGNPWTAKDSSGNEYSWHICSEDQGLKGCTSSAVCQQPASGDAKSCGKLDTQHYSVVGNDDGSAASVLYNGGTQCQDGTARQTTLTLRCADGPARVVGSVMEDPANKCFLLVTMSGEAFCSRDSQPPPLPASGCYLSTPAGYSYNLTAVNTNGTLPWSTSDGLGNQYLWQLCTPLPWPQSCHASAVCQLSSGGGDYSCGLLSSASWAPLNGVDNGLGLSGTYNGGAACVRDQVRRSSQIQLVCASNTNVEVSVAENSTQPCAYLITMTGSAFCGNK